MNIEKIKNFNQDEQKTLNFFELLRNEIIRKDNELNEGIDFIFGRKFANKIDILLNLVERLQKENEELKNQEATQRKINELLVQRYSNSISVQTVKDKIEELEEELEIMKVDNMYGRYKEYGGKTKWERLFETKYAMHDALQELLEGDD